VVPRDTVVGTECRAERGRRVGAKVPEQCSNNPFVMYSSRLQDSEIRAQSSRACQLAYTTARDREQITCQPGMTPGVPVVSESGSGGGSFRSNQRSVHGPGRYSW
jgi:hypothetical protein